jgi:tetratricopeptide (TPR) repeat protein
MRRLGIWLLVIACAITAGLSGVALERISAERSSVDSLLYLPNGKHLRLMSLGQAQLLADLIYIWAIQYYSNYERADRYRYVEHVFGEVIAELDPHYIDAYWLGALILTVEAQDLEGGLRLLEQGIEKNPDQWILPYLAAWESYRVEDYERAASYFERAAAVPGAPPAVLRMRAGMFSKAGDLATALQRWSEVLEDPRADAATRAIAERQVRDLVVRIHLRDLQEAVDRFRIENGHAPASLDRLVGRGYIQAVPRDPDGREYGYDPLTGRVGSTAGRVLGGS